MTEECVKVIEDRERWWRNSHDERIRDGSEMAYIIAKLRALKDGRIK